MRELKIEKYVLFLGYRENVYDFMNLCDIVCNCSIEPEPFGRTIIEAMALKKVVFSTNLGGPLEIIENGVDGFLCPLDADIIARKIIDVLENRGLAQKIGENAYKKAFNDFNIENQIKKIESLYEDLI